MPPDEGCKHYRNKCEILAPCCSEYVRCFRCHDEEDYTNHTRRCDKSLDCSNISAIRCVECKLEQAPAKECKGCHIAFAEYVCLECSLYRQDCPDGLYHCPDCGICRVGEGLGISHWHCHSCSACLFLDIDREEHSKVCRPLAAKDDCCICFERMHDSPEELVIGHYCGHFLHKSCCDAYFQTGKIQCPICTRPLVKEETTTRTSPPRRDWTMIQWVTKVIILVIIPAIITYFTTLRLIDSRKILDINGIFVVGIMFLFGPWQQGRPWRHRCYGIALAGATIYLFRLLLKRLDRNN